MFLNISSNQALNISYTLKTSIDKNNPDGATVMQVNGHSGFIRPVMDITHR